MKRFGILILLFVIALAGAAKATNPAWLGGVNPALFFTNSAGTPEVVTADNPLPTKTTGLTGNMRVSVHQIATGSKTLLSAIASGVVPPFWLTIENTGAGRVRISDTATPTIWGPSIAASETWAPRYYTSTSSIGGCLMAPDGAVSTISALLEW